MRDLLERLQRAWANLNDREQRLLVAMGSLTGAMLLALPLYLMVSENWEIEERNVELRTTLEQLQAQRTTLMRETEERRVAKERYKHKTGALGSFLEQEAKKQGLTLREVTDQPEKAQGNYLKRSVGASMPGVALTPVINLLSSIVSSPHPVAIDHIQIEHFQSGDQYNVKIGVLTYDKQDASSDGKSKTTGGSSSATKEKK